MAEYIKSKDIIVAPAVRRSTSKPEARLLSEQSMVNIINKLIDRNSFVITKEFKGDSPFEFNIYGYYFRVSRGDELIASDSATDRYATITLDEGEHFTELIGQDDDQGNYTGLTIQSEKPDSGLYLHILTRPSSTSTEWRVPVDGLVKFTKESLEVSVDGGEIK